jgi:hypothetical protein
MKKIILFIFFLLVGHCLKAQFALTPDGLKNVNDITSNTIVIKHSGISKEKLSDGYRNYAKVYSENKRGLSFFDNESGHFMIKFDRVGRFGTTAVKTGSTSFTLLFVFKDGLTEIQVRDFKLHRIGLFKGDAKQTIFSKKGKLSREGKILKPMVEREVNSHFNEIVNTVSSLISL